MYNVNIKKIILIVFIAIAFSLVSCNFTNFFTASKVSAATNEEKIIGKEKFSIYNYGFFDGEEVYVLRNQGVGQSLGIVIKTKYNKLIVFDGGRIQDGDLLYSLIKELGGEVYSWFFSHVHDDHIGAFYNIIEKHKEDILIKNIYYSFPEYTWLRNQVGEEAELIRIFEDAVDKYTKYMKKNKPDYKVNTYYKIKKDEAFVIDKVKVKAMNECYKLEKNTINNSTITYKIYIADKTIMNLGDMGKEGGEKMIKEVTEPLKSDFVVMAHHGQKGVGEKVYKAIDPDYCIWCTTRAIYNNEYGTFETEKTKSMLKNLKIKDHFVTLNSSFVLK